MRNKLIHPQCPRLAWILLIFTTSCYVIPFEAFIRFVQGLSRSIGFQRWFEQFWIGDWFFVVKGWHMTEYAILLSFTLAALRRWPPTKQRSETSRIGIAFGLAVLFAASDEWHQIFVPGREGCVRDVLIDSGGAFLAALYWLARQRKNSQHLINQP